MYLCIYVSMYLCIYVSMYLCMYMYVYVCICMYMYVYVCICMHICICMYISISLSLYIYIYTHISKNILTNDKTASELSGKVPPPFKMRLEPREGEGSGATLLVGMSPQLGDLQATQPLGRRGAFAGTFLLFFMILWILMLLLLPLC